MPTTLLVARVLLAGVLAVAGASKLFDPHGLARAAAGLGVPDNISRGVGRLLPIVELVLSLLLLLGATAWWASVAASCLFVAFAVLIGTNLRSGNRPTCNCFGELHDAPISEWTLARNLAFVAIGLFVILGGYRSAGPGLLAWGIDRLGFSHASALLAALVFVALILVVAVGGRAGLGRERRLAGLPVGVPAPEWVAPDLDDVEHSLTELRRRAGGRSLLFLFVDPKCEQCQRLLPEVPAWESSTDLAVVVIGSDDPPANAAKAAQAGLDFMLVQRGTVVAEVFGCETTPSAVVIDSDGRVGSRVATGTVAIRELVATHSAAESPTPSAEPGPLPGEPVPPFALPDLDGVPVDIGLFGGRQTVVVFWDPMSRECQELLPDLRIWERSRPAECQLLVVSQGTPEVNRALGFTSTVVLDDNWMTARAYGAFTAPTAVLVDGGLRIATPPARGARDVVDLAERAAKLSAAAARMAQPSVPLADPVRRSAAPTATQR